jgi:HPt (histidine-containing phosphotransfer) domain-containing protein
MPDPNPIQFIFNENLDRPFLEELFNGDFTYAEDVFADFLSDLPSYWQDVETAWQQQQVTELRAAVHKCKTLFGYVGLTSIQQFCQEFEDHCIDAIGTIGALTHQYELLFRHKEAAWQLIEAEHSRLQRFNGTD